MKLKLFHKMFGAFLLTSFILVTLMVGIMRFYMSRNFTDFMNRMEMERLDAIVEVLADAYEEYGSWEPLRENPALWRQILMSGKNVNSTSQSASSPNLPTLSEPGGDEENPDYENERMGAFGQARRHRHRPDRHFFRILRRLTLLDAEKHPIAGMPIKHLQEEHILREIVVGDNTVGWLALLRHEHFMDPPEMHFMKQQTQVFVITAGGILLLAAVVSFLLSRHFLAPIRELAGGTRALSSLKLDTRIGVHTQDELGQLASDFNAMAQTLDKYERMRKQWVSDIAHELRTPLSILQGEIEAMQDGVREMTPHALDSLHSEILHVSKIVRDLHELSMADSGEYYLNRQPVNPVEVLRATLELFQTRLSQEGITVKKDLAGAQEVTIMGDADRLAQLYSNLIENTLRYADRPGTLTIGCEQRQDWLLLGFQDSGPGVPEEAVRHLFDRLYRVDASRTRAKGGSGIGLAICKAIAEAHGGSITAMNAPSGGLMIEIRLPIERNPLS